MRGTYASKRFHLMFWLDLLVRAHYLSEQQMMDFGRVLLVGHDDGDLNIIDILLSQERMKFKYPMHESIIVADRDVEALADWMTQDHRFFRLRPVYKNAEADAVAREYRREFSFIYMNRHSGLSDTMLLEAARTIAAGLRDQGFFMLSVPLHLEDAATAKKISEVTVHSDTQLGAHTEHTGYYVYTRLQRLLSDMQVGILGPRGVTEYTGRLKDGSVHPMVAVLFELCRPRKTFSNRERYQQWMRSSGTAYAHAAKSFVVETVPDTDPLESDLGFSFLAEDTPEGRAHLMNLIDRLMGYRELGAEHEDPSET